MYYSVSETGLLLGVCPTTIRRWDKNELIKCFRTLGNQRRIHIDEIQRIIDGKKRRYTKKKRRVATYARVTSHEQKKKGDLGRQQKKLRDYCENNNLKIVSEMKDVASGLNTKRKGLSKLVTKGKISELVINYPDRLTRFGFGYIKPICDPVAFNSFTTIKGMIKSRKKNPKDIYLSIPIISLKSFVILSSSVIVSVLQWNKKHLLF